jgi:hypothetical protein
MDEEKDMGAPGVCLRGSPQERPSPTYRGYHIYFDPPPIPTRSCDWHFYHDDFDGAEDSGDRRSGSEASEWACCRAIDDIEDADYAD